jgi:hypothetical protein
VQDVALVEWREMLTQITLEKRYLQDTGCECKTRFEQPGNRSADGISKGGEFIF